MRTILFAVLLSWAIPVISNELPDMPKPKNITTGLYQETHFRAKPVAFSYRPTWLDLGLLGATLADGITTRRVMDKYSNAYEGNPVTRVFIGRRPTYERMIPLGAIEVIGVSYLAHRHPKMRWLQVGLIAGHTECAVHNAKAY